MFDVFLISEVSAICNELGRLYFLFYINHI